MSAPPLPLVGAVLTGGSSRRFGRDKATEVVAGLTLAERAARALASVCAEVVFVSDRPVPGGRRTIPDLRTGAGPLAGIEAALAHASEAGLDGALVLACDLPLVGPATLRRIGDALGRAPAAAPEREDGRGVEPLCAAYRCSCLPAARVLLDSGERAAKELFAEVGGLVLDPAEGEMLNVNTPAAAARAGEVLEADGT